MAPKTLGDYTIIKTLGQGTLGTMYLAEHRLIKRPFALKVFPEELSHEKSLIQKFEKELEALSFIDHPHIVKMHNVSTSNGQLFFVMDCIVDGVGETTNLEQYIAQKGAPLEEKEVLNIVTQVAEALSWAHEKKVGDEALSYQGLKLSNVLIGKADEHLKVFLSDFGLSRIIGQHVILSRTFKAIAEAIAQSTKLTKVHEAFVQSYAFLPPEQKSLASGEKEGVKADIYAFGVLTYYLLMHKFPEGFFEMPQEVREDLSLDWEAFLRHTLAQDPKKRIASISEAMQLLQAAHSKESALGQLHFDQLFEEAGKSLKPILKPQELARPEYEPNPGAIFQMETVVAKYSPQAAEEKQIDPLLTEMRVVPEGSWHRGSSKGARDETPRHLIRLSAFAIDIHPVTNEQFVRFLEAMGGEKDANNNDIIRLRDSRIKRHAGKLSIESGYAKHPVVGVSWYGAIAYAKWVGKRLPTEAEWEVAAMGGLEGAIYPTGEGIERTQANFFSSDTTAVMSYPPNGYGLFDMAGNVYEWCQDWYGYHYYESSIQEPENPEGPLQGVYRVLRGGCWKSLKEDLRVAHRHRNNPGIMNGTYGFRCAADVSR